MNRNILKKLGAVALSALMTLGIASQGISTVEAFSAHVDYDGKSKAYLASVLVYISAFMF